MMEKVEPYLQYIIHDCKSYSEVLQIISIQMKLLISNSYCKHFPSASITVIEMKILIPYCTSKISKFRMVDGQQFKVRRDLSSIVFYFSLSPRCEDFHFVIPTLYFFCCMIFFYLDIWFQMKI